MRWSEQIIFKWKMVSRETNTLFELHFLTSFTKYILVIRIEIDLLHFEEFHCKLNMFLYIFNKSLKLKKNIAVDFFLNNIFELLAEDNR